MLIKSPNWKLNAPTQNRWSANLTIKMEEYYRKKMRSMIYWHEELNAK